MSRLTFEDKVKEALMRDYLINAKFSHRLLLNCGTLATFYEFLTPLLNQKSKIYQVLKFLQFLHYI